MLEFLVGIVVGAAGAKIFKLDEDNVKTLQKKLKEYKYNHVNKD